MKKTHPPSAKSDQPARRETAALTSEQMDELASHIFWGDGREAGRVSEHWPEAQVRMLAGPPANRTAL
jgi:hypothetical protein